MGGESSLIDGFLVANGSDQGNLKSAFFAELVDLAHEKAQTLWIDPQYQSLFLAQIAFTIVHAQSEGLTLSEIATALQLGEDIGKQAQYLT